MQALPKRKHRPVPGLWLRPALGCLACAASLSLAAHAPAARAETPAGTPAPAGQASGVGLAEVKLDVHQFRVAESYSGSTSYYRIVEDPTEPFLRAVYRPPLETVTLGFEVPEQLRTTTKRLRWKWRAMVLPKGGDECKSGFTDSAAIVYVMWKRGFKWYALKYVWSTVGKKGQTCDQKRNLFVVQDTIIRQTGGPTGVWMTEEIDPAAEFRAHFENGDANAEVPAFVGIGIMSDGDQTKSVSAADYTGFVILH